jgi:hypothetical protein
LLQIILNSPAVRSSPTKTTLGRLQRGFSNEENSPMTAMVKPRVKSPLKQPQRQASAMTFYDYISSACRYVALALSKIEADVEHYLEI